jgi:hypothetical protein
MPRPGNAVGCARRATEGSQLGNGVTQLRFSTAECEKQEKKRCKADAVFSFHGWKNRGTKTASPLGLQTIVRASKTKETTPFTALAERASPADSLRRLGQNTGRPVYCISIRDEGARGSRANGFEPSPESPPASQAASADWKS